MPVFGHVSTAYLRDEVISDTFNLVRLFGSVFVIWDVENLLFAFLSEDGTVGVDTDHDQVGQELLEFLSNTSDGAASTSGKHDHVEFA